MPYEVSHRAMHSASYMPETSQPQSEHDELEGNVNYSRNVNMYNNATDDRVQYTSLL